MKESSRVADAAWVAFHVVGGILGHALGLWVPYWAAFLFVEVVGLVSGFPMTSTVRTFLRNAPAGPPGRWRFALVLAWSFWFSATFGLFAPVPLWVAGPIVVGFYLWLGRHFFDEVRRRKRS